MINFGSLAVVDIIANYSLLCVYLAHGGHGVCLFKTPAFNHFWAICLCRTCQYFPLYNDCTIYIIAYHIVCIAELLWM